MISTTRPRGYFTVHYILFRMLGMGWWHHPGEGDTRNFQGWYLYYSIVTQLLCVFGFVALESIDPFVGEIDIDRLMFSLSFVITHDLTLIKLCIFYFRHKQIQDIIHTLEIGLYDYYQNNAMNRATLRLSRIMTASFVFFGWMTIINSDAYAVVQDIRWKADVAELNDTASAPLRTLPFSIYILWNYQSELAYALAFVFETAGLLWTGHIVLGIDTFIASVILHMSNQFAILHEAIVTAYDRTMLKLYERVRLNDDTREIVDVNEDNLEEEVLSRYSKEDIESALSETLKSCFRQHQTLINCVEKFANTYSNGFMIQLMSSTAAICVVMVQLSQDASGLISVRLVTSLAFFACVIIQLALQCFTGNELTLQAGRVADAVMHSKWEKMSPTLRRDLMLAMMRAQRPLRLTAAGFAYMNADCFIAILKAAYSYYAVLSQKQNAT